MKKLTVVAAISLNTALCSKGLKAKPVTGENYLKVIYLKTKLRNDLSVLEEAYSSVATEYGMTTTGPGQYEGDDKDKRLAFSRKINELNKTWKSSELELNFIPEAELREFCTDQDLEIHSILFEHLLKKS